MFITALFILSRTWKQPRCPSADEWIRKLWYIYTMEYYSAINKAFLNEQCKIEENNKMGKNRDLFKKTGDIKGIFHARMSMIKDRNGKDLTKAEEIKKRWQETKIPRGEHRQNTL